ncbi:MAG: hypothetical protein JWM38_472 [Sphingomonas bacterium]|jgi:membrane protease YdiL (CAAX protease family)|nr:hypothetical protein [Sphingomonas bacterium]MDB5717045.1 hypothetical protein [Sphingomonas bacterium]
MQNPERRSLGLAITAVVGLAVLLILPGYFSVRLMDVGGRSNADLGITAAILAAIACVAAAGGGLVLWAGRKRPKSNMRVALLATLFVSVFLLLVAFAAGTSSTEPASTTVERS